MPILNTGPNPGGLVSLGFVLAAGVAVVGLLMALGAVPVSSITVGGSFIALGIARMT